MRATLIVVLVLASISGGCVAKIPFTPRDDLVRTQGVRPAKKQLTELMLRAHRPAVGEVEIDKEKLRYHHHVLTIFDIVAGTLWTQMYWQTLTRIDLYDNNRVFFYTGTLEKGWLEFLSQQDAMQFANLLWSFRAWSREPAPAPAAPKKTTVIEKTEEKVIEQKTVPK